MADCKHQGIGTPERFIQIFHHSRFTQFFLISEKPGQGVTGSRVGILLLQFPPVLDIGVMSDDIGPHFS